VVSVDYEVRRAVVSFTEGQSGKFPTRWLEAITRDGVVYVYFVKERRNGVERMLIAEVPKLVELHDVVEGEVYVCASEPSTDGTGLLACGRTLRDLLTTLHDEFGYSISVEKIVKDAAVESAFREVAVLGRVYGSANPGITPEGFADPFNRLDLTVDRGRVEQLVEIAEWAKRFYPGRNAKLALTNVAILMAKCYSPEVKRVNRTFVDYVVWNYGRGGEGKTTLVEYVLLPLVIDPGLNSELFVVLKGAARSEAQYRNLIDLNRLPLILDEQTLDSLDRHAALVLHSTVGHGIVGVHAERYGRGIGAKFKGRRGVVVITNVPFAKFLKRAVDLASDVAFVRRVIELQWENETPRTKLSDKVPKTMPILGILDDIWKKHKEEFYKTRDLLELAERTLEALEREYGVDLSDYREALEEVRRAKEEARVSLVKDDRAEFVERLLEIARRELGVESLTREKLLFYLLSFPEAFEVRLSKSKYGNNVEKAWDYVKRMLCEDAKGETHPFCGEGRKPKVNDPEFLNLLAQVEAAGYTAVVVPARSKLCPGSPRRFLGVEKTTASIDGRRISAYYVPMYKAVEILFNSFTVLEEVQGQSEFITSPPAPLNPREERKIQLGRSSADEAEST